MATVERHVYLQIWKKLRLLRIGPLVEDSFRGFHLVSSPSAILPACAPNETPTPVRSRTLPIAILARKEFGEVWRGGRELVTSEIVRRSAAGKARVISPLTSTFRARA